MTCREFNDIIDSYLSGELLVETNHSVIRHLEQCRDCREILAVRRAIRERLSSAVRNTEESIIDSSFAARLRSDLRSKAVGPRFGPFAWQLFLTGAACVIMITLGSVLLLSDYGPMLTGVSVNLPEPAMTNPVTPDTMTKIVPAVLEEAAEDAIDDHFKCALFHDLPERPISLEAASITVDPVNEGFDKVVSEAIVAHLGKSAKVIAAHHCLINGRHFAHVVLLVNEKLVSILLTKVGDVGQQNDAALCTKKNEVAAACFGSNGYGIFVVSETEGESVNVAKWIGPAIRSHVSKRRSNV
ncbi:MAG: zf-HC2 domain-containing protein [Pyrinomonadaceae bacterium]|nr:zf-HC2 domain-containing protein [Pyrinomonadaceae bacterium]